MKFSDINNEKSYGVREIVKIFTELGIRCKTPATFYAMKKDGRIDRNLFHSFEPNGKKRAFYLTGKNLKKVIRGLNGNE